MWSDREGVCVDEDGRRVALEEEEEKKRQIDTRVLEMKLLGGVGPPVALPKAV